MDIYFDFGGFIRRFVKLIWIPLVLAVLTFGIFIYLDSTSNNPVYLASADIMLSLDELNGGLPLDQSVSMTSSIITKEEEGVLDFLLPDTSAAVTSSAPSIIVGNNIDTNWVRTCGLVFGSQRVLDNALKEAGLNITYKKAVENIRLSYPQDTVIRIGYIDSDPDMSVKMAQLLTKYGISAIDSLINLPKVNADVIAEPVWGNLQAQNLPSATYRSTVLTWIVIIYCLLIALFALFDPRIQSCSMAENILGIRFLGAVRKAKKADDIHVLALTLSKQAAGCRSFLFCTAKEDDGCSALMAELTDYFNASGKKAITVNAKNNEDNPLNKLKDYDIILIDTPPVNDSPVAAALAGVCDRTVFVIQYKKTSVSEAVNAVHMLENTGAVFTGFVMTGVEQTHILYHSEFSKAANGISK